MRPAARWLFYIWLAGSLDFSLAVDVECSSERLHPHTMVYVNTMLIFGCIFWSSDRDFETGELIDVISSGEKRLSSVPMIASAIVAPIDTDLPQAMPFLSKEIILRVDTI